MSDIERELWESDSWRQRRADARKLALWYKGKPLDETEPVTDPETGQKALRYPFKLNTPQLACDVHRDMTRGKIGEDPLFLKAKVSRRGSIVGEKADAIEELINNGVWRPSRGGPLLNEAILSANIFGGTCLKLSWEPWRRDLPYGLAVRSVLNPSLMHPEWDPVDRWRFLEVWYGYEISARDAKLRYGIDIKRTDALYMEHWTESEYRITVDGQVPKMTRFLGDEEGYTLEGENKWGIIPFYYAPHERATDPWGRSQIEGREELCKEINARTVNVSDMFRGIRPDVLYATDLRGKVKVTTTEIANQTLRILDMGMTPPVPNAKSPALHTMPAPDIPDNYSEWPSTLSDWRMQFDRLSPAIFGMDDTQSGRITGVAVAQRLWTTTSHTDTERLYMGTAKTMIDTDIVRLFGLAAFKEDIAALLKGRKSDIEMPDISENDGYSIIVLQTWPDPLPLDKQVEHQIKTDKLRAKAMSVDRYMREDGVTDIDGEKQRIQEWDEAIRPEFGGGDNVSTDNRQDQ
jgi:hypothetical protein